MRDGPERSSRGEKIETLLGFEVSVIMIRSGAPCVTKLYPSSCSSGPEILPAFPAVVGDEAWAPLLLLQMHHAIAALELWEIGRHLREK